MLYGVIGCRRHWCILKSHCHNYYRVLNEESGRKKQFWKMVRKDFNLKVVLGMRLEISSSIT